MERLAAVQAAGREVERLRRAELGLVHGAPDARAVVGGRVGEASGVGVVPHGYFHLRFARHSAHTYRL